VGLWDHWLWVAGSLALAVVVAHVMRWVEQTDDQAAWVSRLVNWPYAPVVFFVLRFLFYVGIPFAALTLGSGDVVVAKWLGLQPLLDLRSVFEGPLAAADLTANRVDWVTDIGWTVGLGVAVWAVLATGWVIARRSGARGLFPAPVSGSWWDALVEAGFHEVHWAFYRDVPIVALYLYGNAPRGVYWGAWAGLGLVALEAMLNPRWWSDLTSAQRAPMTLTRAAMAVLSVVLFLKTENLWLMILVHWIVTWGLTLVWRPASDSRLAGRESARHD
jgi:hypothetical protein